MAEVLLFHHALGLTDACLALADELRSGGHTVHTPDLFGGRTFASVDEGVAHANDIGWGTIAERGAQAAQSLPAELVYAGLSLGVVPAQMLAQTRPGARGALLLHATIPLGEFAPTWPAGVPVQIHTMEGDELGDVDVARAFVAEVPEAELFLYPGTAHLFAERGSADHDERAAALLVERALAFLGRVR